VSDESLDDIERALKVGSLILVRGDHVGETADGETVIGSSAPMGTSILET
jgi:hypothetical protein